MRLFGGRVERDESMQLKLKCTRCGKGVSTLLYNRENPNVVDVLCSQCYDKSVLIDTSIGTVLGFLVSAVVVGLIVLFKSN